mgnify:FL=1
MTKNDVHQLKVSNQLRKNIIFVKIDKCLFHELKNEKKCDCILFDNSIVNFVEIKSTNKKGRSNARATAVLQLESTIKLLTFNEIEYSNLTKKAVICFKNDNQYPIKASQKSQQAIFKIKYNVNLVEGNLISF